ncbi:MAG: hypothetical protein ACYTG0_24445 [Planctomycetota bacterium]|jgi:hypothetical protein
MTAGKPSRIRGALAVWAAAAAIGIGLEARAQEGGKPTHGRQVKRRILVNDDGEVRLPDGQRTWEDYLAERLTDAVDTQVDSYLLNVAATDRGPGIVPSIQSSMAFWASEGKLPDVYAEAARRYIRAARGANMEIFASIRMNDVHDASLANASELTYPLKIGRHDLLLGSAEAAKRGRSAYPSDSVMGWFWSGLNWGKPEVRRHFLEFIAFYCPQFDFDGLELDFFRHPLFFRLGEEEESLAAMTEFVRKVRETLDEIGRNRGWPYLLAARVPDCPAFARRTGLDVERWLEDGLLDLLVAGGGYMPYAARLEDLIDAAHRHGVPAYPCLNHFRGPVQMQSVASNFWALGGDGFYLFNYFGVTGQEVNPGWGASDAASLRQIGDPKTLRGLPKLYLPDPGASISYTGYSNAPGQLPVRLIDGSPVELVVGDDVEEAQAQGTLDTMVLRVSVGELPETAGMTVQVNGVSISPEAVRRADAESFEIAAGAPPLRRGLNELVFLPGRHSSGRLSSQVTSVELSVQYTR